MNKINYLASVSPFGVKCISRFDTRGEEKVIYPTLSLIDYDCNDGISVNVDNGSSFQMIELKNALPILRPLSDILEEINHKNEKFTPIDFFDIGEEDNYEFADLKVYKLLESIAKNNCHHDIMWLPFAVTMKLIEWNFDIYDLISKDEAVNYKILSDFEF